ncbi:Uncharacterised protein [Mycobacteroides abscessus subsp. abscessus]|nr:Uncharacterised protein [Mycobacteroides abscessus subsp. abscessus]
MLSKSMPSRLDPQFGMGFLSKVRNAFRRMSSIHSGSFFFPEISRTTASESPRCALAPATSESDQP